MRRYRHERHDHDWWKQHYVIIVLVGGGYYYQDSGYWYPAWGYDPNYQRYRRRRRGDRTRFRIDLTRRERGRGIEPEEADWHKHLYNASESSLTTEPVKKGNSIMAVLKKKAAIQKSLPARGDARCRSR